jgi:hypothetical protein
LRSALIGNGNGVFDLQKDVNFQSYSSPAGENDCVDTRHFGQDFAQRLMDKIEDLDAHTDGLLIRAENFQAVRILHSRSSQASEMYLH